MKHLGLIAIFSLFSLNSIAKKFEFPIEVVTGSADLIVIGEITRVNEDTYNFRVTETIKGKEYQVILVAKFREWECDTRFAKHKTGQRLFLFLKEDNGSWVIINGSTGEIPIINDQLTLQSEEYKHVDYQYRPYKLTLSEFKEGIKGFANCFQFIGEYRPMNEKPKFRQICQAEQLRTFRNTGKFTAWLYDKLKEYAIERV